MEYPKQNELAGPVKRSICGLLSLGGIAALGMEAFSMLSGERNPTLGTVFTTISACLGIYIFGLYAVRGHG